MLLTVVVDVWLDEDIVLLVTRQVDTRHVVLFSLSLSVIEEPPCEAAVMDQGRRLRRIELRRRRVV